MTKRQTKSFPRKRESRERKKIDARLHRYDKEVDSRFHGNDKEANKVIPSQEGIQRERKY